MGVLRVALVVASLAVATGIWAVKTNFSRRHEACESLGGSAEVCSRLVYGFSDWIDAWGPDYSERFPTDTRTRLILARQPELMAAHAYCYFAHRKWFDQAELGPESFARSVQGFSIVRSELAAWREAVMQGKMESCHERVRAELGVDARDPELLMERFEAVVVVNPLALNSAGGRWKTLMEEARLVLTHEKIHVFQQMCPSLAAHAGKEWASMSRDAREEAARTHPGYQWSDSEVAARERLAFLYEKSPASLVKMFPECSP